LAVDEVVAGQGTGHLFGRRAPGELPSTNESCVEDRPAGADGWPQIPRRIEFLAALPIGPSGKILKRELVKDL
jgi:acyl-CoA synthetase (AMP-forming)/AMP-acid ligase II